MWLLAPLIFILAWVKSHSISQSITESAAWCGGYMAVAGVIIALNMGSIHIISEAPDGPGSILPILGGFLFMWVSHVLWRRRGGHLQRREVPLTRLAGRAYIAFRGNETGAPARRRAGSGRVTAPAARVARTINPRPPEGSTTAPIRPSPHPTQAVPRAATPSKAASRVTSAENRPSPLGQPTPRQPVKKPVKAPSRSKAKIAGRLAAGAGQQMAQSDTAQKAMTNRWVRGSVKAVGAFVNDPKKESNRAKKSPPSSSQP